ncbi:MAG: MFS transporter [Desulfobacterales bacterium]|nr:MFS transporter [Desulfobacterales bacterium]
MDKEHKFSFRFVISSQYFLYFGALGIFLPYFNLYCYHLGFSGFQIGILSSLRSFAMVLFPLIWGILADRFQMRRSIYIFCSIISTTIWVLYLYTIDFELMLIITFFYAVFYAPIISFLEAFTMDLLGNKKKSYGRIRAWGSISFILTVIVVGKIIDLSSVEIILAFIFIGSCLQAILSFKIPGIDPKERKTFIPKAKFFFEKRVLVFLFCAFLMLVSHGTYYGFFSIHLENLGYGNTFIGFAWALASIAEILVMLRSDAIFKRFALENVLIFSFIVASLRWFILYFVRSPMAILFSQFFHAVTYGTFHMAAILYMDHLTPKEAKTLGQAINNALTYGLGMMVGFFFNGYFYERLGSFNLFIISGLIALVAGFLLKSCQIIDRRSCGKLEMADEA